MAPNAIRVDHRKVDYAELGADHFLRAKILSASLTSSPPSAPALGYDVTLEPVEAA